MEENVRRLTEKLKYLDDEARKSEIAKYEAVLNNKIVDINSIAKEIYTKRGINYDLLNKGFLNKLNDTFVEFGTLFRNSPHKGKMYTELLIMVLILVFLKVPFDLVRDIGYEYIELISTSNVIYTIWNLVFLLLYSITFVASLIVLFRNFNTKYRKLN